MLVVSPLRSNHHETKEEEEAMECNFPVETGGDFLDCINFDEIFIDEDGDLLPDLEMEPDLLAEFPVITSDEMDYIWMSVEEVEENNNTREEENHKSSTTTTTTTTTATTTCDSINGGEKKSTITAAQELKESKDLQGNKRKLKVDWTPELHRRFVQAVEQIGLDKAVPSRILEFMGVDCLTRHNVASHLQKYKKHLQAREAKRSSQIINYSGRVGDHHPHHQHNHLGVNKRDIKNPNWLAPTTTMHMGFPPPNALHNSTFRVPLHVWGHPSSNHSFHIWPPKHLPHSPPSWAAPLPLQPPHAPYWHLRHQPVPHNALTARIMGFPHQTPTTVRFPSTLPSPMCSAEGQYPLFDSHPTKECIDEAIGDVLSKPWLPLPLGLKPPSMESVLGELQHQGVSNMLSTTTCSGA